MKALPAPREHFGWLVSRSQCHMTSDFRAVEVVDERGAIRAMVGYANWTPGAVQMHIAIDAPIAGKHLLDMAFSYPFLDAGLRVAYGLVATSNARSMRLAKRLGFHEAHRIKDGFGRGVDLAVMEMHRDSCRWIAGQRKVA